MPSASENDLTIYGYQLLQGLGLHDKAIKVFRVATERFPKSANAWDSLGEGYAVRGDKENAVKSFRKALNLNPYNATRTNSEKYLRQFGACETAGFFYWITFWSDRVQNLSDPYHSARLLQTIFSDVP